MGQRQRVGAANLHGLARVQREKRWTTIMDVALAFNIVLWIASLTVGVLPAPAHWVLPLVIAAMLVHRFFVVLERQERAASEVRRERELPGRSQHADAHAA